MKAGMTLPQLATELDRQSKAKLDLLADTTAMKLGTNTAGISTLHLTNGHTQAFGVRELAHRQIADRLKIPYSYYERIKTEQPMLLDTNVNTLFHANKEKRMVRTLDGVVRAFLSNKYRRLDNSDLAEATLPVLREVPELRIESANITETRFYIKAIFPRLEGEVKKGDVVQAGVCIRNSEVGHGQLAVDPLLFRLACLNGAIMQDYGMHRHHTGRRIEEDEEVTTVFRDETIAADDKAFFMMVQDLVRATMKEVQFKEIIDKLRAAAGEKIEGDPIAAVEVLANRLSLTDREGGGVLRHLIDGQDLSKWGVVNAVTAYSQEVEDYDRATDFEVFGGKVLELPDQEWHAIAHAERSSRKKGKRSLAALAEA